MAGRRFNIRIKEILPNTYINYESGKVPALGASERGITLLPCIGADYGPEGEVIEIQNSFPNQRRAMLGHDITDDTPTMRLINDALQNAVKVKCYIPKQGEKARAETIMPPETTIPEAADGLESGAVSDPATPPAGLTAEAKYGGPRGNDISFSIVANPLGGYDVSVFLESKEMERFEGLKVVEDLILEDSEWITFSGDGPLMEVAGVTLTGGTAAETTNEDLLAMLDAMDNIKFTTLAMPITGHRSADVDNTELLKAVSSKIIAMRDGSGKYVNAVLAEYASNHESIINVTNGYVMNDGRVVPPEIAVAWVAGLTSASTNIQSNTWVKVPGAVKVYKPKNMDQQKQAILDGEFFFIGGENDEVKICKDINSLTDFELPNDESYSHNRIMRVIDTFCEALMVEFPPNRFSNNSNGWDLMDGLGAALLKKWEDEGALQNVAKGDFAVDRALSKGDATYFDVALQPVDSSEKLFFSIKTL